MNHFRDARVADGRLVVCWPDDVSCPENLRARITYFGKELSAADLRQSDILLKVSYAPPIDRRYFNIDQAFDAALAEDAERTIAKQIPITTNVPDNGHDPLN